MKVTAEDFGHLWSIVSEFEDGMVRTYPLAKGEQLPSNVQFVKLYSGRTVTIEDFYASQIPTPFIAYADPYVAPSDPGLYGSVVSADGQSADSSNYYSSPSWLALEATNHALDMATIAVQTIAGEIEIQGLTPELNAAANAAGAGQALALQAYVQAESVQTVGEAEQLTQAGRTGAEEALAAAEEVGLSVPVAELTWEPAPVVESSPVPLLIGLAGLWAAFR